MGERLTDETSGDQLLDRVAGECDLPGHLLIQLAALQTVIPDVNVRGAKAELGRRVAAILDDTAAGRITS
jgi:hypothetical protein